LSTVAIVLERMRSTPGLRRDVIALVVCAVVGVSTGGFLISRQDWQPPWSHRYEFSAVFSSAPGVHPQSVQEVRIAGVKVGRIVKAEPTDGGRAKLTMSIDPDQKIYKNAHVLLRAKSPVNVMYVALDPGGPPAPLLPDHGVIPIEQTARPVQPYEVLDRLDGDTRRALTALINESDVALAAGPRNLAEGVDATSRAFEAFQPVVTSLASRREEIARLVTAFATISRAVGDDDAQLSSLVRSLDVTLNTLSDHDGDFQQVLAQFPGLATDLKASMAQVRGLTDQLDPTLQNITKASDVLPGTLKQLTGTVHTARGLVRDAKPVVRDARPVVADLRPFAAAADSAFADLRPVAGQLPHATTLLVPWMQDLAAFVYQTSSAFSLHDVNGGFGRLNAVFDFTNPTGGLGGLDRTGQGR